MHKHSLGIILFIILGGDNLEKKIEELKTIEDDYVRAYRLVSYLFRDKKDKAGLPYLGHLTRVSDKISTGDAKIAALLHDVVEDIDDISFTDLKNLGFSDSIIDIVKIVTKDKSKKLSYHDWISWIIKQDNIEAIKVKYADMLDNFNLERLNKLDEEMKRHLISKYKDEVERLREVLDKKGVTL